MIYGYGLWDKIAMRLQVDLPLRSLRNIQKYNKLKQLIAQKEITPSNLFFFLRFSEGDRKLQSHLAEGDFKLYPNPEFSKFIEVRENYLPQIDEWTKFPLKRVYGSKENMSIKGLAEKHFKNQKFVLKLGNLHTSKGKWLIDESRFYPYMKYKMMKMETLLEEYVSNARSIRVGIIGDANNEENYYLTEHINNSTWLKNNAPEEENTYSYDDRYKLGVSTIDDMISETREIATRYGSSILGVDWVINSEKTGLLEVNDMIGMPDGEFAFNLFYREIRRICMDYLEGGN